MNRTVVKCSASATILSHGTNAMRSSLLDEREKRFSSPAEEYRKAQVYDIIRPIILLRKSSFVFLSWFSKDVQTMCETL